MSAIWPHVAILALVTLQRLAELRISSANTRALLAKGGREVAASHYPLIVAVHVAWLASLWLIAPGRPISLPLLALFAAIEASRVWVLRTLGPRWTTRIIVVPGERLVTGGPYRFVRHPNYVVVAAEIAVLPLVFGLWQVAVVFTVLNLMVMMVRIRAEDEALGR